MTKRKQFSTRILCVTGVIFFHLHALSAPDYTAQAEAWVKKYVLNSSNTIVLSAHDAQQVANLLYYSYERSAATLAVQKPALNLIETTWNSWQNITHTRMNPSKKRPHRLLTDADVEVLSDYLTIQETYHRSLENYATVSELVVKGHAVQSATLKEGIKELRAAARTVVSQALLDVKHHIAQLAAYAQTRKTILEENAQTIHLRSDDELRRTRNLKEFFTAYIPKLAVSSFTETEQTANSLSNESWRLLFGMQEVSSYVWHTLETQRAAFYKEYYQALYNALQKSALRTAIFSSIVESDKKLPSLVCRNLNFIVSDT